MGLSVLGINHNTASIDLRERAAFLPENLQQATDAFARFFHTRDVVILSTCNRTEVYSAVQDAQRLQAWLGAYHDISAGALADHIYFFSHEQAFRHLVRVSSGLDSMMLGETQIFGQVKQAVSQARQFNALHSGLGWYFEQAFNATKYIRSHTAVGELAVSTGLAVVRLTEQIFNRLSDLKALLVGAGEMNTLVARHLVEQGIGHLTIINRTYENAARLRDQLLEEHPVSIDILPLEHLTSHLASYDLICSCTASADYLIKVEEMKQAVKQRKYRPVVMVDLAVPRDIDPKVNELEDVYLHTVDDLHAVIRHNQGQRQLAASQAEMIVDEMVSQTMDEARSRNAAMAITTFRREAELQRRQLVEEALGALSEGKDGQAVLETLSRNLTNRLLHEPTLLLKKLAAQNQDDSLQSFIGLFEQSSSGS